MNLDEIKEIIEKDKGKFIIVENGEPTMVILSFDDYKKTLKLKPDEKIASINEAAEEIESPEREIKENFVSAPLHGTENKKADFPEFPDEEENSEIPPELENEPLKIEDLPF